MNATTEQRPLVDQEVVSRLAVQIWLAEGCEPGREMEHWLRAEKIKDELERELSVAAEHDHRWRNGWAMKSMSSSKDRKKQRAED